MWVWIGAPSWADDTAPADRVNELVAALGEIDARALPADDRAAARGALETNITQRLRDANRDSTAAWRLAIDSRAEWQSFRDEHLDALRRSLGRWPKKVVPLDVHSSGTIDGEGFVIDKLLYQTRPGLWASANLYRPAPGSAPAAEKSRPAILISHSHHNPKTEPELQTMGMTWARLGALVLVPDHLGHGERRQHPFPTDADYERPFKRSRQDYYFRYDMALQLDLVGESLMGHLAWDLMRGLDVLLAQDGVDPQRTIVLGAVAGGGDPAAVAAALDPRFAAACVFNFGGPQPETRFPLPENPEDRFGYAGSGSWESTRNLRDSASEGFLPWVIVGGIAPRRLIYAHEFSWDQAHDPVWRRLLAIYARYGADDHLGFTHGSGSVKGQPPESTHCNNIGSMHRRMIYPALARWFGMPADVQEYTRTRPAAELQCWTDALREQLKPKLVRELAAALAAQQIARAANGDDPDGDGPPPRFDFCVVEGEPRRREAEINWGESQSAGAIRIQRGVVKTASGIPVPLVLLLPAADKPAPLVIGVAQQGKQRLLAERREFVARLLTGGVAVCLVDVRGTGETAPDDSGRDRTSHATSLSSSLQMLGETLPGDQLADLVASLQAVTRHKDIDGQRIALWGDSLAKVNPADRNLVVPHAIDEQPAQAEPLGGLLALVAAGLGKDADVGKELQFAGKFRALYIRRPLASYASAFEGPRVYLPHDGVIPGAIAAGDLPLRYAEWAPRPLRLEGPVDAGNRALTPAAIESAWSAVRSAYQAKDAAASLVLCQDGEAATAAAWLVARLTAD